MNTNKDITPYGRLDGSEGGFARIPNALLQSTAYKNLNGTARSLLQCFYNKWMKQRMAKLKLGIQLGPLDPAIPFARGMAEDAGISEGSYRRDIGTLQSMGFLEMTERGSGRRHSHFRPNTEWRNWAQDSAKKGQNCPVSSPKRTKPPENVPFQDKTVPQGTDYKRMTTMSQVPDRISNQQEERLHEGIKAIRQGDQDGPGRGDQDDPASPIVSLSSGTCSRDSSLLGASEITRVETGSLTQEILGILECAPESLTLVNLAEFDNSLEETGVPGDRLSEAAMLARECYAERSPAERFEGFTGIILCMSRNRKMNPMAGLISTEIEFTDKSERQARIVSVAKELASKRLSWNGTIHFLHRLEEIKGQLQGDDLIVALAKALDDLVIKYPSRAVKGHIGAGASA